MRAYERLLRYAKVHTASTETTGTHPSFEGEFTLAEMLKDELIELGAQNVFVEEHCYVYGKLPATPGFEKAIPIGFIAHMDTSDAASGLNVKPVIHENYDGKDVSYPAAGTVMSVKSFPFLKDFKGETLITSDGTTLLGADDKAGIAEIMTAVELLRDNKLPHGDIFVAFTPDEEIGEGPDFFDLKTFAAKFAYTVDGGDTNCLEYENFNAASAVIKFKGFSVHPGSAKNIMINAQNLAHEFHAMLPAEERPEHTENREGFFHLSSMSGNVTDAQLSYIIRDHDRESFENRKKLISEACDAINAKYGEGSAQATVTDSYYNMLEKVLPHKHLIDNALNAIKAEGLVPETVPIRGGTDGARLSFVGLPCPNLGTGGYNYHGTFECITAERMDKATGVIMRLIDTYSVFEI